MPERHPRLLRVDFRSPRNGQEGHTLIALFEPGERHMPYNMGRLPQMAAWLARYGYRYIVGTDGLWERAA